MFSASQNGHKECLDFLCKIGGNVQESRDNGATPAYIASCQGQLEILKYLCQNNADINQPKNTGILNECMPEYLFFGKLDIYLLAISSQK